MKTSSLFFILFFFSIIDANSTESVAFIKSNGKISRLYMAIEGSRIASSELCKKRKCIAYHTISGQKKLPKKIKWISGGVNPTSTLCKDIDGVPKVGYLPNDNEVSICLFKDDSFIFGWDLMDLFKKNLSN